MNREEEFNKVKELIKKYYEDGDCGLYNTRNVVGDIMSTLFKGKYFTLDICFYYSYFEVFGTTNKEFEELKNLYKKL